MKITALLPLAIFMAALTSNASATTYKYYDTTGHFLGSSTIKGNQEKFYDPTGHFLGSTKW